ncbi:hypothetical protein ACUH7Y_07150 [Clostridium beijerinckii]|uniref:Uncharacterized protein n=1 Tax=Clostridium beijerinckii TaxID=1520 RepID=A0A7X9XQ99_CLOBE|nr:hypothetical protein [Clostridium beijerinckii]NMF06244.1 hypothetical protein [Clostridium beijerinckii]
MIEFILLMLAFMCANVAYYCMQRKRVDNHLKALENDLLNEFKAKK